MLKAVPCFFDQVFGLNGREKISLFYVNLDRSEFLTNMPKNTLMDLQQGVC